MRENKLIFITKEGRTNEPIIDCSPFPLKITSESSEKIQQERELLKMKQEQCYQSFLRIECL